jgi:hypothetical protein
MIREKQTNGIIANKPDGLQEKAKGKEYEQENMLEGLLRPSGQKSCINGGNT